MKKYSMIFFLSGGVLVAGGALFYLFHTHSSFFLYTYIKGENEKPPPAGALFPLLESEKQKKEAVRPIYLPTPEPLRAIYMTSWVAGTRQWRDDLVSFIESSEINAIVIDVKDYSGKISFIPQDRILLEYGAEENRIPDIQQFLRTLNGKGIYAIARISVFQDPYIAGIRPDLAVKRMNGNVWTDRKGLPWIDPAAREYWDYTARIAKEAHAVGFDELNFDYIRFPSDGNMRDIAYDHWDEKTPQADVIEKFFAYLRGELDSLGIPLSADLFGMTATNYDDLNIGQVLEKADRYFDYIAPMVYPSHYPPAFIGLANPAAHPYEVIHYAMAHAAERMRIASSSPAKLRPWIQDFDLGAVYDAGMILQQKQAVYDAGITSWMAWDPKNQYTREAYRE